MRANLGKRIISALFAAVMVFSMLPTNILAVYSAQTQELTPGTSGSTVAPDSEEIGTLRYMDLSEEAKQGLVKTMFLDEAGVYHIQGPSALADFASRVNGGESFAGQTIVLDHSIDLEGYRPIINSVVLLMARVTR